MKKKFSTIILVSCIFTSQAGAGIVDWAKENPIEVMLASVAGGVGTMILYSILKHKNCKCCRKK